MSYPAFKKSQLIEVVIPPNSTTTNIPFPDQPYLRGAQIWAIEVVNGNDMALSPQNNAPMTSAQMMQAYLSIYLNDPDKSNSLGLWNQLIPFTDLHRIQNASADPFVRDGYKMVGQTVSWDKTQIITPVPFGNTGVMSILFNISFTGGNDQA